MLIFWYFVKLTEVKNKSVKLRTYSNFGFYYIFSNEMVTFSPLTLAISS